MNEKKYCYSDWLQKLKDSGFKCYWCGKPVTEKTATKDHMQPLSRGGTDEMSNIAVACADCNSKKGNRNAAEYRAALDAACGKKRTGIFFINDGGVDHAMLRAVEKERDGRVSHFWRNPPKVERAEPEAKELLTRWLAENWKKNL